MRILILSDGYLYCGGYSSIALKIYNNLKKLQDTYLKLYTLIFKNEISNENEIFIDNFNINEDKINTIFEPIFKDDTFEKIICTSPWSFNFASYYFKNSKIIYIKGGGLMGGKSIMDLENKFIYDVNVNDFLDGYTSNIENDAIQKINEDNYVVLPTTKIMYHILNNNGILKFQKNKILEPLNYYYYENYYLRRRELQKEFDLIFAISDHSRIVKNSKLVYELFKKNNNLKKIVIGRNCEFYENLENTIVINKNINFEELFNYFKKSKILLIPSFFDTGPSTLIEGIICGCIPICYKNCGYSKQSIGCEVMDNLNIDDWNTRIRNVLNNHDVNNNIIYSNKINRLILSDKKKFEELLIH